MTKRQIAKMAKIGNICLEQLVPGLTPGELDYLLSVAVVN